MEKEKIEQLVKKQREYFYTGATLDVNHRKAALIRLRNAIKHYEKDICEALKRDLGKSTSESFMCEIGMMYSEITYMLKHIDGYAKEQTVHTPLAQFPSKSYRKPSPYGVTLIMSPWNYPFLLTMEPLVDALAAGNTAILKPSAYSPHTGEIMKKMIEECFPKRFVAMVMGGRSENTWLLEQHFDYIFFTGSQAVGKEVMRHAAKYLTPVTLELGGKSPCIVDKTADIKVAARRIVFGKYLNCGQTCVAPDYVYCDPEIKDELIAEMKIQIRKQYGRQPLLSKNYGKIINEKHFKRLAGLMDADKIVCGGGLDMVEERIEPTIMDQVTFDDAVMQEEIFGPILPILTYNSLDEAIAKINSMAHPLALYMFSNSKNNIRKVTSVCGYGGGCINDTIIHLATSDMAFGGFGESGMGSYHGKAGFDTFTHYKSIVDKKTWLDLPMRYQPYNHIKDTMVRLFMR